MSLDADEASELATECKVTNVPSYRVFKNGKVVPELSKHGESKKPWLFLKTISDQALEL